MFSSFYSIIILKWFPFLSWYTVYDCKCVTYQVETISLHYFIIQYNVNIKLLYTIGLLQEYRFNYVGSVSVLGTTRIINLYKLI